MNNLLVIIVTYNAMQWAERCFDSLKASSIENDVFVVDNGSSDGTQDFIKINYPSAIFKQSETNLGFGKANNIGLQYAIENNYDYVYLLNQDAWVMPDTFEKLIEISKNNPEYGILSPIQTKANMESMDDKFVTNVIYKHQKKRPYWIEDLYFKRKKDIYEVSFVMAAHWLITRICLETVGGFNPSFPHYGEDDNYINRVNYWNFKAGIVTCTTGVHDRGNPIWSKEKYDYINNYIKPIVYASNPIAKKDLLVNIIKIVIKALIKREKKNILYAYQLFKERNEIKSNLKKSTSHGAFLG